MAGGGENPGWHDPGSCVWHGRDAGRVGGAGNRSGIELPSAVAVWPGDAAGGAVLGSRRTDVRMQRGADANRPDVQPGARSHDLLRMRLLSVERAERFSNTAEAGSAEPAGVRERGPAGRAGAAE